MKLLSFSIYDNIVGAFTAPFFCLTEGHARRALSDAYRDRGSPDDFVLYEIGVFNTDDARFYGMPNDVPKRVCTLGNVASFKSL